MPRITLRSINERIITIKNEVLSNLNKRKLFIKIVFMVVFLFGAVVFYYLLVDLEDYIPPNPYSYRLTTDDKLESLEDFKIYHHFSENLGNISFKIEKQDYREKSLIIIHLPAFVDNRTIDVYTWEEGGEQELVNYWRTQEQNTSGRITTWIRIEDFPPPEGEGIFYSITYKMKIFPSGHFSFQHSNTNLYGYPPLIALDLGKNYQCAGLCIDKMHYVIPAYPNTNKEIRLEIEKDKSDFHSFILSAVKDIRVKQGLFLGLMVSLAMSFLLISKDLLEELKYKKS